MNKPIDVFLLPDAEVFLLNQSEKVQLKLLSVFDKTKSGRYGQWFKKMVGTKDLFEFRVVESGNYYRLFAFWDSQGETETLIVCTHGLVKKSNKTPLRELKKAEKIMNNYFENNGEY